LAGLQIRLGFHGIFLSFGFGSSCFSCPVWNQLFSLRRCFGYKLRETPALTLGSRSTRPAFTFVLVFIASSFPQALPSRWSALHGLSVRTFAFRPSHSFWFSWHPPFAIEYCKGQAKACTTGKPPSNRLKRKEVNSARRGNQATPLTVGLASRKPDG
jgi:hypothetical protein